MTFSGGYCRGRIMPGAHRAMATLSRSIQIGARAQAAPLGPFHSFICSRYNSWVIIPLGLCSRALVVRRRVPVWVVEFTEVFGAWFKLQEDPRNTRSSLRFKFSKCADPRLGGRLSTP